MDKFERAFGAFIIKFRWYILIVTLICVSIATSGIRFLKVSNDTRVFFDENNPQLQAMEAMENIYTKSKNVMLVLSPNNNNVFSRETLSAVEHLTKLSWKIPYSNRVDSISNFQHTYAKNDEFTARNLYKNAQDLTDDEISNIKSIALSEPLLKNRLLSSKGDVTAINVNILLPEVSLNKVPEIASFVKQLADEFRKNHPDIKLYLSGGIMIDDAFGEASMQDIITLQPIMLLVLVTIIGISLRSLYGTICTLFIILISMMTGMGIAGWLGISITAASSNAPTIILTLAVADSVHILASIYHFLAVGSSKYQAIKESMRINFLPVLLTSATTAIGFLTMNFSDSPPFRDLGNIVAAGVMAAFFYTVLLLPALLYVLPLSLNARSLKSHNSIISRISEFIIKNKSSLIWIISLFIIALTFGISKIELNDDFMEYLDRSFAARRAADFIEEHLTGLDQIEYSLDSRKPGGVVDPDYLLNIEKFANWYRAQDKVVHVSTISDIMKKINMNLHGDNPDFYAIPEDNELSAQYYLLYEMSLPFGLDLNNQVNLDKSSSKIVVTLKDVTNLDLYRMDEMARDWLRNNAPSLLTYGTGESIIWAHIGQRNINSMLIASFLALLFISVVLVFALKNIRIGLLSLIPNLSPAFMAFGVWGYFFGRVGLSVSVLVAMTLGIIVDDTIHFLSKYLRARREHGLDPQESVRYSFNMVGLAMVITSITLIAGFLVLCFSGYRINSDMGLISAVTIAFALILDFTLLPILLLKFDRKKSILAV